jgi:hypothetical protein
MEGGENMSDKLDNEEWRTDPRSPTKGREVVADGLHFELVEPRKRRRRNPSLAMACVCESEVGGRERAKREAEAGRRE